MISKETVIAALKKQGIQASQLVDNPALIEKATLKVYSAIPIPFRWFVGKKRISSLLNALKDAAQRTATNFAQSEGSKPPTVPPLNTDPLISAAQNTNTERQ